MSSTKKIIRIFYLIILINLVWLSFILFSEFKHLDLEFYVFDVGQGDAILIRTPHHQNILIDGGPDNKVVYKLGQYLPFYDREIDLMILTHPHADHVVGLVEVLKRYKVKKIFTTGVKYSSADYLTWLNLIKEKNIETEIIDSPRKVKLSGGVELLILFPDINFLNQQVKNLNNVSIVSKLIYGDFSALLMGDLENEENLVGKIDLTANILKSSHHGSNTGNSLEFLEAVNPTLAIISCGQNNKFGFPQPQTSQNLHSLGIKIFRTDQQGDFIFRTLKLLNPPPLLHPI